MQQPLLCQYSTIRGGTQEDFYFPYQNFQQAREGEKENEEAEATFNASRESQTSSNSHF